MDLISPDEPWSAGLLTSPAVEIKLLDSAADEGTVEGYAATFNGVDHGADTIAPGAFAESLMAHRSAGSSPAMLWSHRQAEPIGRWTAMGEDSRGLRVRGVLNRETQAGRTAHAHLKAGDVTGLSIGFQIAPGGSAETRIGRTLTKLVLHEVSVVSVPMDPRARITGVKSLASRAELEDLLRESGLAKGAAKKIAAAGWSALSGEPTPTQDPVWRDLMSALDANLTDLKGLIR